MRVSWRSFPWSLNDRESPQISRSLLAILTDLKNVLLWTVSTQQMFHSPFQSFKTVPNAQTKIGITVTLMLVCFWSQARSKYLSVFSLSFIFALWFAWTAKFTRRQVLLFIYLFILFISTRCGLLDGIGWSVCIAKPQRILLSLVLLLLFESFSHQR